MCARQKETKRGDKGERECGSNRELGVAERASGVGTGGAEPKFANGWVRDGSGAVSKIAGVSLDKNDDQERGSKEKGGEYPERCSIGSLWERIFAHGKERIHTPFASSPIFVI